MMTPLQNPMLRTLDIDEAFYRDYLMTDRAFLALQEPSQPLGPSTHDTIQQVILAAARRRPNLFEQLMAHYPLDSAEGVYLLRICEALLRCHDDKIALQLISENLAKGQWLNHSNGTKSPFTHWPSQSLDLSGLALHGGAELAGWLQQIPTDTVGLSHWIQSAEKKILLKSIRALVRHISHQFVIAPDIPNAIDHSAELIEQGYSASFDMLGEAALTFSEAETYFKAYCDAIIQLGELGSGVYPTPPEISVKLSALDPNYQLSQWNLLEARLIPRLEELHHMAQHFNVNVIIDAEEVSRLELSLRVFQSLVDKHTQGAPWKLGMAVQAYQKRALPVLQWLSAQSKKLNSRVPVRLVKGAYWDQEIAIAQQMGLAGYPVFTRKNASDENFLICARYLLSNTALFPQFASHNPHTLIPVLEMARDLGVNEDGFELQKLLGMGDRIYDVIKHRWPDVTCRVYCPVGPSQTLLPYLVRRLLENGSSSSFLNHFYRQHSTNPDLSEPQNEENIPLPETVFEPHRANSAGLDWANGHVQNERYSTLYQPEEKGLDISEAYSIVAGQARLSQRTRMITACALPEKTLGHLHVVSEDEYNSVLLHALSTAAHFQPDYALSEAADRIESVRNVAHLLKKHEFDILHLLVYESGKCLTDAFAELREAIDFCYYYSSVYQQSRWRQSAALPAVAGESNLCRYQARGVTVCISPWNFPLAIFVGQITAALLTGNCVIAKPSSHTPLLSTLVIRLMHQAGIPDHALQLLNLPGQVLDDLLAHQAISTIAFTGATATAKSIQQVIATRRIDFPHLIAETGGINGMLADSSANPDQVLQCALQSAFNMAGQRCSALRYLYLPKTMIDEFQERLVDAMHTLSIGLQDQPESQVGPLVSNDAVQQFWQYLDQHHYRIVGQAELPEDLQENGFFVPPTLMRAESLNDVNQEIFGPLLQLIPYDEHDLESVITQINQQPYGLTFAVHSRLNETVKRFQNQLHVGNLYINRNQIGATVACQPFGGIKASGTGSKAGGQHYLSHFVYQKTVAENTAAIGGDVDLLGRG